MKLKEHTTSTYLTGSVIESAVGLILVNAGDRMNAMAVSFFSEVAHHPTALWVGVAETSLTHAMIEETGRFSLAVLNQRQGHLAMACGSISGRDADKCSRLDLFRSPAGFLFLNGALASTGCKTRHKEKVGDHTIFVADIVEAGLDSRKSHLRQLLLSDLR
jgi:flavin reductase (DIM6/NTAB) family NADH-FMN oxidoreductase RutF